MSIPRNDVTDNNYTRAVPQYEETNDACRTT